MILIGQFDSPFVRRVGIALTLYEMAFEHRPWSAFGDTAKITAYNPLSRVPTLVLDDGEVLLESYAILDHLDEMAGPERALIAPRGAGRRQAFRAMALAMGLADKAVSLVYERVLHSEASEFWLTRCRNQIAAVATVLEADRAGRATPFWFSETPGHADIAVACALIFAREAHPGLIDFALYPALAAHVARCEALPAFGEIRQEFIPPNG